MDRKVFKELTRSGYVVLDGASGTLLQAQGMPVGACSEAWGAENPDPVRAMHAAYFEAGAQIVVTFTLGGTAPQLGHYGIKADQVETLNEQLAAHTVQARDAVQKDGQTLLVSGDIGTTGLFLEPAGDSSMKQIVDIFRQQVRGLLAGGVDLFSIETMMDLGETIAAIRAVRAECDLPVIATMTFDKNGRTLSGNTPLTAAIAMAAAGADAVGANCSSGPDTMGELLDGLAGQIPLPIVIKPNAGLPHVEDGNTVFDMDSETFVSIMTDLAKNGIGRILGGCCGTTPAYITALKQSLDALPAPGALVEDAPDWLASSRAACPVPAADAVSFTMIESVDTLQDDIMDAMEDDPDILGLDLTAIRDEDIDAFRSEWLWAQSLCTVPLVFKSESAVLLETLTGLVPGRPGIVTTAAGTFHGAAKLN